MTDLNYEKKKILDIVNENDEIVDSRSRVEIHRLGLLHREIQVWMFDENKNVFFQKMGLHKKSAGLLDATVGGHVDKYESYLEAAVRETKEETGISVSPSDLIFLQKFKVSDRVGDGLGSTINNFITSVYIYKKPIKEQEIKKEIGIPGGGFQKLSYDFLCNVPKEHKKMIINFMLTKEVPEVLGYLRTWKN